MKKAILVLAIAASHAIAQSEDKLAYVFQVVRHGARAPLTNIDPKKFKVGPGELTASGMRERLLNGRFNRKRYIEDLGFLDKEYNNEQIFMLSTDVFRTIQSGYSELMGLYPPGSTKQTELSKNEIKSLQNKKGLPPILIRQSHHLNSVLKQQSIIDGYVQIPVYNYLSDDSILDFDTCPYADDQSNYYWTHKPVETFADVSSYVLPIIKYPLGIAYNLTHDQATNMTFKQAYTVQDHVKAEIFEGDSHNYSFSNDQWYFARQCQKWALTMTFLDDNRKLKWTKFLQDPIDKLKQRVQTILNQGDINDDLKFYMYSAHDDDISNLMIHLNPKNYEILDVPYASSITFELHYNSTCMEQGTKDEKCFNVLAMHNGNPIFFDYCINQNKQNQIRFPYCSYQDFIDYVDSISTQGDVYELCSQKWTP